MTTVKKEMHGAIFFCLAGVALLVMLFVFPGSDQYWTILLVLGIIITNLGFSWMLGIRSIALNWLLVKKDPELAKLLDMDYDELKKAYMKIREEQKKK